MYKFHFDENLRDIPDICETFQLDIQTTTRAQVILAHILQWQKNFLAFVAY